MLRCGLGWAGAVVLGGSAAGLMAQAVAPSTGSAPTGAVMPRPYRGVSVRVGGIFVTPVPNAPFSATVQIVSHDALPDGSEHVVTTLNHIARSSSGRIYNERRALVSTAFRGEPRLLSVHTYDPSSRLSIFLDPQTRLAREMVLRAPEAIPATARPPAQRPVTPGAVELALGTQKLDGVELTGTRRTLMVAAEMSGTGKPIEVVDEYWYSPELSIYMIIRHNDPRTGEQMVAVSKVERTEPAAEMFAVPAEYKVVDETTPEGPVAAH